jgi:2-polyprenyl-3-methyl-5-hydroxy-6-metoxy-1,4-benzoquinol methylase
MLNKTAIANHATEQANHFAEKYIELRKKENRVYTDEEVKQLPVISKSHVHYKEWLIRKQSSKKLADSLQKKNKSLKILEVGCGNGWLCHFLSTMAGSEVTGCDINTTELKQAARVFNGNNLHFVEGGLEQNIFRGSKFDIVIFASTIQYFRSLPAIVDKALERLLPAGEIHILDSPFYDKSEIRAARQRTNDHYTRLGFPGMSEFYFHHSLKELEGYKLKLLYDPRSFFNKIGKNKNPFPWVCIKA